MMPPMTPQIRIIPKNPKDAVPTIFCHIPRNIQKVVKSKMNILRKINLKVTENRFEKFLMKNIRSSKQSERDDMQSKYGI